MILMIPSAALLDTDLSLETGVNTHALIPVSGKPLFANISKLYRDSSIKNLKVFIILKSCQEKLLSDYGGYIDRCIESPDSQSIYETIASGLTEICGESFDQDEEVIIHMGDTLLSQSDLNYQSDCIYASQGSDFYRRTVFTEKKGRVFIESDRSFNHPNNKKSLLSIGVYSFSSVLTLKKAFSSVNTNEKGVDLFFRAIEEYSKIKPINTLLVKNWMDFGHLDTYYESKLSCQNLRHFNSLKFESSLGVVTKRSKDLNFVHQVRWFQLQPKEVQYFLPRVYDYSDGSDPFISMEMLTLPTLSELFTGKRLELGAWLTVFTRLQDITNIYSKYSYRSDVSNSMLHAMYVTKTVNRLNSYLDDNPGNKMLKCRQFSNGFMLGDLPGLIEQYVNKYQLLSSKDISPIHGDFCLTNLLYDQRSRMVKMIDPRGIFSVPGIYGDGRYDIAKLFHSIVSGYDFLVADLFSVEVDNDIVSYKINKTGYHNEVADMVQGVFTLDKKLNQQVRVIESLLFLSMIPLHRDRPDRQMVMAAIGLELFNYYYKEDDL